jgi:hypothetical protein
MPNTCTYFPRFDYIKASSDQSVHFYAGILELQCVIRVTVATIRLTVQELQSLIKGDVKHCITHNTKKTSIGHNQLVPTGSKNREITSIRPRCRCPISSEDCDDPEIQLISDKVRNKLQPTRWGGPGKFHRIENVIYLLEGIRLE